MKRVYVLFAQGFEEVEALTVVDYLRRVGAQVSTISTTEVYHVVGAHGVTLQTEFLLQDLADKPLPHGLVLPGGLPGATNLRDHEGVLHLIRRCKKEGSLIAAICAAPIALDKAGVLEDASFTCYPTIEQQIHSGNFLEQNLVVDGNLITARGPALAVYFALAIAEHLYGPEKATQLRQDLLLDLAESAYKKYSF